MSKYWKQTHICPIFQYDWIACQYCNTNSGLLAWKLVPQVQNALLRVSTTQAQFSWPLFQLIFYTSMWLDRKHFCEDHQKQGQIKFKGTPDNYRIEPYATKTSKEMDGRVLRKLNSTIHKIPIQQMLKNKAFSINIELLEVLAEQSQSTGWSF